MCRLSNSEKLRLDTYLLKSDSFHKFAVNRITNFFLSSYVSLTLIKSILCDNLFVLNVFGFHNESNILRSSFCCSKKSREKVETKASKIIPNRLSCLQLCPSHKVSLFSKKLYKSAHKMLQFFSF